jgi:hypothetical protein
MPARNVIIIVIIFFLFNIYTSFIPILYQKNLKKSSLGILKVLDFSKFFWYNQFNKTGGKK